MKKNHPKALLSLVLAAVMIFSTSLLAFASDQTQAVSDAALAYLEKNTYARYFYEPQDMREYTIESVPQAEQTALAAALSGYAQFREEQEIVPYETAAVDDGALDSFVSNLKLFEDEVAYYAHLNELEQTTYVYFTPSYRVVDCVVDGAYATVNVYETIDFQYADLDEPSAMTTHYYVSLVQFEGEWLIAAVESDSLFHQMYRNTGFDLAAELAQVDLAHDRAVEVEAQQPAEPQIEQQTEQTVDPHVVQITRSYIAQNAVNYAFTYSTATDSGSVPSYRNEKFYYTSAACQLFASQCVWAGFGGSNTQTDINNRKGMDTTGDYQWWSTKTQYNNPLYNDTGSASDQSWNSWILVSQFKKYIDYVKSHSTETGIVADTNMVAYNSDDMVGSSGLTKNDLIGAVLHVKGLDNDGVEKELSHAIIVTNATGTTRSTVYYTSYNNCAKNVKVSLGFPSGGTKNGIYVMVPRSLRGANGFTANYLYGDLQNALKMGTSGKSVTLYGRAKSSVSTLWLKVYAPGATAPTYSYSAANATVVSGTALLNKIGEWRVEVASDGLDTFTYVIRVVA